METSSGVRAIRQARKVDQWSLWAGTRGSGRSPSASPVHDRRATISVVASTMSCLGTGKMPVPGPSRCDGCGSRSMHSQRAPMYRRNDMSANLLVTGALGVIGSAVVQALDHYGFRFAASSRGGKLASFATNWRQADLSTGEGLDAAMEGRT